MPKHEVIVVNNDMCIGIDCNEFMNDTVPIPDVECDLYLADSTIPGGGRGIFTTRLNRIDNIIETCPAITVPAVYHRKWILDSYVYSSLVPGYSVAALGTAMMFNHQILKYRNVINQFNKTFSEVIKNAPYTNTSDLTFTGLKRSIPGDELFSDYGDEWFNQREKELRSKINDSKTIIDQSVLHHSTAYLQEHGICLSHVYVAPSLIPKAGRSLFAKKNFVKGELIYLSPVLVLPKHEVVEANNFTILLNYCVSPPSDVDIALLPIGITAMLNHQPSSLANVNYHWNDTTAVNKDPNELLLDVNSFKLNFVYFDSRDIDKGEELTINYGDHWVKAWNDFIVTSDGIVDSPNFQFRHPVEPPANLFPSIWDEFTCFGSSCEQSVEVEPFL